MKRVAMVVYSYYPADPRVRREAEALVEAGISVDVTCLWEKDEPEQEEIRGVTVYRLSVARSRSSKGNYLLEYGAFLLGSFLGVTRRHMKKRYDIVHVHNMPDILVFAGLIPRIMGARIVLDLHDPMPEVYMAKYGLAHDHAVVKTLRVLERLSIRLANAVLTPNLAFRNLFVQRGCPQEKIQVVMNSPQETVFQRTEEPEIEGGEEETPPFVVMYHGTIVERHGLDDAVHAMERLKDRIPGLVFWVYGSGDYVDPFQRLVRERKMEDVVQYRGQVTLEEISRAIQKIDVGIIPNKKTPFTDLNLPTRIFEYLCFEKPVIAPRLQGILDYFDDQSLFLFEPGDVQDLADTLWDVYRDGKRRKQVLRKGVELYQLHTWEKQKEILLKKVRSLLD